ncbi:thiamine biosynthesis lipoprotein [Clostridium amylolyticum]|uniref:FAD:protein FMN transferase n=1 Tax=Clostridium amylolyticum TaxID=1121298 RepID=A0A1M6B474_9CLOT|nr:FAD:protein FMN transferase [Clostridium amylolyticum]SHI43408.1 thiamine biosynthesis lipoprotein [Clostridium amylolyticum]
MSKTKKLFIPLLSFLITASLFNGCSKAPVKDSPSNEPLSKTEFFMGTVVSISLYDKKDDKILDKAFNKVKQIESELSINKEGTEIDKVNNSAGKDTVKVSKDAFINIEKGLEYSKLTEGSFDITIGPLVKLWSIGLPEAKVPTSEEINNTKSLVGYKDLEINKADNTVKLKKTGMKIDLGGIAKGYTADAITDILKENGVEHALVDLGGNIYALGNNPEGRPWKIGVQNPFDSRGKIVGYVPVENKSVVTSGIYERYIEKDGKKYHHILNPFTGYPYDNELAGITIISDKSIDGDALSTSVFSKGLEGGMKFIEKLPNIEAVFVTKDNKVYITSGLKNTFKLTNEEFKQQN